jgi:hypothetical protein
LKQENWQLQPSMQGTGIPQLSRTLPHWPAQFGGSGIQTVVVVVLVVVVVMVVELVDVVVGKRQTPLGRLPGGLLLTHDSPRQQLAVVEHCTPGPLHGPACVVVAPMMPASAMANKMRPKGPPTRGRRRRTAASYPDREHEPTRNDNAIGAS